MQVYYTELGQRVEILYEGAFLSIFIYVFMKQVKQIACSKNIGQYKNKNPHSEWISTHCNSLKLVCIAGDLTYCCAYVLGPSIKYVVKKSAIFLSPSPYFVVFLLSKIGNCLSPPPLPGQHSLWTVPMYANQLALQAAAACTIITKRALVVRKI